MTPLRAKYIRDLTVRGRAQRTQRAYTRYVSELARYYKRSPELISYEEVTDWLYHLIKERQLSASSVVAVNAVRFLYGITLGRHTEELTTSVPHMKHAIRRPEIYARSELEAILVYHKGWTAVTKHGTPWVLVGRKTVPLDEDVWELYDTSKDWSQANNLAKQMPEKLRELQRLWLIEATRYNVLPIDDGVAEKINPDTAGRPVLIRGKTQLLFGGMGRLSENCVLNIKNKSHSVTAEIEVPESGGEGVIVAQGGNIGGWSLYAKNRKLKYCYNVAGIHYFYVEATEALPAGEHQVRMEFAYAGGGLGKGGQVTLYIDGKKVGEGSVPMTQAMVFSADDGCDVGEDSGAPVSPEYSSRGNAFHGRVKGVQLAIAEAAESLDHLVSKEEAIRIAMARQ